MSLLVFILLILVIMALVMWAVYYVPFPPGSPEFIKPLLYVLVLIAAIILIVHRAGMLSAL